MHRPGKQRLVLLAVRRALGLSFLLYIFYLFASLYWEMPAPTVPVLAAILLVVSLGVFLGVAFSHVWPLPYRHGWPRVIRTVLLTVPAIGFGLFVHLVVGGPRAGRAYWIMFALAAWLGSTFIREEESDVDESSTPGLFGGWQLLESEEEKD